MYKWCLPVLLFLSCARHVEECNYTMTPLGVPDAQGSGHCGVSYENNRFIAVIKGLTARHEKITGKFDHHRIMVFESGTNPSVLIIIRGNNGR